MREAPYSYYNEDNIYMLVIMEQSEKKRLFHVID